MGTSSKKTCDSFCLTFLLPTLSLAMSQKRAHSRRRAVAARSSWTESKLRRKSKNFSQKFSLKKRELLSSSTNKSTLLWAQKCSCHLCCCCSRVFPAAKTLIVTSATMRSILNKIRTTLTNPKQTRRLEWLHRQGWWASLALLTKWIWLARTAVLKLLISIPNLRKAS